jgi:hypothetical protein
VHILFLVLTGFLAIVFAISGASKVLNLRWARDNADHLGLNPVLSRFIGVAEIAIVLGLIAGIFIKPVGILSAAAICGLMVGAMGYHVSARDGGQKVLPAVLTAAAAIGLAAVGV